MVQHFTIKEFYVDKNLIESYFGRLHRYYFHTYQLLLKVTSTSPAQERASHVINMLLSIK